MVVVAVVVVVIDVIFFAGINLEIAIPVVVLVVVVVTLILAGFVVTEIINHFPYLNQEQYAMLIQTINVNLALILAMPPR